VLGVLGGMYWGTSRLLDPGADVNIVVDGRRISVETGVSTVGSLIREQRIALGKHDRVSPADGAPIRNDMTVRVLRGFPVSANVNGVAQTLYSAYHDPDRFLQDLGFSKGVAIRNPPKRITERTPIQLRTVKRGTLFLDGTAVEYESPSHTVRELLEAYTTTGQLILGPQDLTTPPIDGVLPETASVTIIRVATDTQQVDEPYDLPDERQPDPDMEVGTTRVQERRTGVQRVTYQIINHDGKEAERVPISKVPLDPATPRIEFYGTHYNPMWDKMAECETGGNWSAGGQTYQGGLGIFWKTWNSYGGRDYAPTAGQATKLEQIIVAERIRKEHGWHAWGCADRIGL
jgi:resuscitation-promoting factor RpfB